MVVEVATVLTVYGIETSRTKDLVIAPSLVATVLTVYGIETLRFIALYVASEVATVLTVYGIETNSFAALMQRACALQQYLPFTVLKLTVGA